MAKRKGYFFARIMITFNKLLTCKIISIIVIITFTVTSIGYGIELPKKFYIRVPVGELDIYQRLIKAIETLKECTRKLTNEEIDIAIQILKIEGTKPTIKEVARLLKISTKDLLLAEEKGDIKGLNNLIVKRGSLVRLCALPILFF